ncbi:MAG: FAD binding domain-containing protein [Acidimicrobiales bacterium]
MSVVVAGSLDEVFDAFDRRPDADLLAGGTDLMVEVNFGRRRPPAVVAVARVAELQGWRLEDDELVLGGALTYTEMMLSPLCELLPGLAQAARTVGSPQIRNAGTLGGNLGTASPAGDTLPVLAALEATVVLARRGGERRLALGDFVVGPKRTSIEPGEVVTEVRVPTGFGTQEFLKIGTRNAMVIAVASVALALDGAKRQVRCALGSVGPVPIRAIEAEGFAASRLDWETWELAGGLVDLAAFGDLVAAAARPIDDHRSTAGYRRHAVGVCAERALGRAVARGPGRAGQGDGPGGAGRADGPGGAGQGHGPSRGNGRWTTS